MCGTSIMRPPPLGQEKKIPKVKEKEKRRNSEKRKEKSRDAARCRRGKESEIFNELLSYLPLANEVANTLDKMSILRLTLNSLRLEKFIESTRRSSVDEDWIKFGESEDSLCDDPALNFMDGFVMILVDDGEQLEPIFVSEGLHLEMGLPVAEMLGVSLETFVHPCDYQELRTLFLGFKENAESDRIERTLQVRMKCTISAKGRVVNIKSAAYKVVKFQVRVFKRNDVQYMSALCEPMGPCFAKLRPTRSSFLTSDVKTCLDFTTQHALNLVFKSVEGFPEFIGFSADELKKLSLYDLIHPADLFEMNGHFKELFSKGYCDTGFYRFLAGCGGYCWISSRAQLVQDTTGKPLTIQCVHYCLGSTIVDANCVLADFQQIKQQQAPRCGLPLGSESFPSVSLLEDGLREVKNQYAQKPSISCTTPIKPQSLRLTATYVNAAELSAGQPSPVAVVGQSKNNQLDNNNTTERAAEISASSSTSSTLKSLPLPSSSSSTTTLTHAVSAAAVPSTASGQKVPSATSRTTSIDVDSVEFRCSGAGQIAATAASDLRTDNVFQDSDIQVHQPIEGVVGAGGVLGACFTGVQAYQQQQQQRHQQQAEAHWQLERGQVCAKRVVSPEPAADCVPDLVSSNDDDEEDDDCPVLESPAPACETSDDSCRNSYGIEASSCEQLAESANRKQLLLESRTSELSLYRDEQELTSQVPSPKAIGASTYNGALIGPDHLLGHHLHDDQQQQRQPHNDDDTENLIESDRADKWETPISVSSIAGSKRSRQNTDPESESDYAETQRCLSNKNGSSDHRSDTEDDSNVVVADDCPPQSTSVLTSTLSVFAPRTEEMSPGFLQIKGGQVLTCEEPGADLTHLAPTAGDSAMPLEVEFEVCDEVPENLFPSLLDSAGCSPLSSSPPYEDPLLGYSDLPPALLDDLSMNLQLEADNLLLPSDWPLPSPSTTSTSTTTSNSRKGDCRNFRNASSTSNNSSSKSSSSALSASSKSMLAALLQSDLVPSSVSQKQRAMVHDWGGTTQPLPESMKMSPKRNTPVKFVPQKVHSTLTINALKRPLSVSQRNSTDQLSPQHPQSNSQQHQQQQRSSLVCPIKRRKTIDSGELQPKPVEKSGSVLMKLLVSGEDLPNGYSCRVQHRPGCLDKDRDLRSAQDYLHSLTQHDNDPGSVSSDTSDFCHLLSADDDLLLALAAVTQE
ncbi:protein similar [Galendromus occidentalis]|uniref:Protein similar n=1 Tax=Galendromus occidentalis TaxID=34638 RepID=A0AAJ7SGK0_9ACAR|nr:protein similar [Galendromus occidentalis]